MGVIDEHWCSECKKPLDKKKDSYAEVDFINDKKPEKHNRAFICEKCLNKDEHIKDKFGKLRMKGNPNFIATIECKHFEKCETYEPRNDKVRCQHIAVIDDTIYCKRRHPGATKLPQEKSKILEKKTELMKEVMGEILNKIQTTPEARAAINAFLSGDDQKALRAMVETPPVSPEVVVKTIDPAVERRMSCKHLGAECDSCDGRPSRPCRKDKSSEETLAYIKANQKPFIFKPTGERVTATEGMALVVKDLEAQGYCLDCYQKPCGCKKGGNGK